MTNNNTLKMKISILIILCILFSSCNWLTNKFCGEPTGKEKQFIDSLNSVYINKLIIEQVPCYPGYIRANLMTEISFDTLVNIKQLIKKHGYNEFLVYDKNNKIIMGNVGSM